MLDESLQDAIAAYAIKLHKNHTDEVAREAENSCMWGFALGTLAVTSALAEESVLKMVRQPIVG
jgi:hypothetical protein